MIQKTYRFLLIITFLVLLGSTVSAQIETNNWFFGKNAGIDFNDNLVTILSDGAMFTPAGCSSISDKNGNLLFYTNGLQVWNGNHQIMSGSTEQVADIKGNQPALIVPKPNDENVYYIFSTIEDYIMTPHAMAPGVYYAEVVFSDEFPQGKVSHSMRITSTTSTRITAIHHSPTNTIRLITFGREDNLEELNRDTFYIFNVTTEGVQVPGTRITVEEQLTGLGAMKISPNGKLIAITDIVEDGLIYIYDFNNDTLEISLKMSREINVNAIPYVAYSVEFSADSEILYFSTTADTLFQFYLTPVPDIFNPALTAYYFVPIGVAKGTLQLASNGKIYIAKYRGADNTPQGGPTLSVINRPDKLNEKCDFEADAVTLSPGGSIKGLPNFVASFLRNRIIIEDQCVTEVFNFDLDAYTEITDVEWDFGDGNSSTSMNPTHQFATPGKYVVKAMITINDYPQPLYKTVEVFPLPSMEPNQTLKQCDLDNDGISNFNLNTVIDLIDDGTPEHKLVFFNSLLDAQIENDSISAPEAFTNTSNPQELFVKITSPEGCESISNFFIETTFTPLDAILPVYTCENSDNVLKDNQGLFNLAFKETELRNQIGIPANSVISFYSSSLEAETKTNQLPIDYIAGNSTVWVRVDKEDFSCNGIGTFELIVNDNLGLELKEMYTICNPKMQPPTVLDGGVENQSWEWRNESGIIISNSREFSLLERGSYSLTVYRTQNGLICSITKEFVVVQSEPPVFDVVVAENNQIQVKIIGEGDYQFSLDDRFFSGSGTSHVFYGLSGGIYTVYVRDINQCELQIQTQVTLVNYPRLFTPNEDGFNDFWKIEGISNKFYYYAEIFIYDRYGKLLHAMDLNGNNQGGWNGMFNGEKLLASDYWFNAIITDKDGLVIQKRGHFSLIR